MAEPVITVTPPALDREPPPLLFHYTTRAGLLGILESKRAWATHIRCLNDSAEYAYAADFLRILSEQALEALGKVPEAAYLADFMTRLRAMHPNTECYVFSLCADNGDRLSQWRAYGRPADAYSLGFVAATLFDIARKTQGTFAIRCEYDRGKQQDSLKKVIDDLLAGVREALNGGAQADVVQAHVYGALGAFDILATTIKDPAFEEEQEWRIVVTGMTRLPALPVKYRSGPSLVIPYVELPITTEGQNMPLREVRIGPAPHAAHDVHAVVRLCWSKGLRPGLVTPSNVPYRNW